LNAVCAYAENGRSVPQEGAFLPLSIPEATECSKPPALCGGIATARV
jgi:hypothetical protein